jgi:hypothetical protein
MSVDASGTLAGALTFAKWRGRNYVRRHAIPSNPRTPAQVTARAIVAFLGAQWKTLNGSNQATWLLPADAKKISTFNEFIALNARNWRDQIAPSMMLVPPRINVAATIGALAATVSGRQIFLSIPFTPGVEDWGLAIVRSGVTGVAAVPANAIAVVPMPTTPVSFADGPLAPGTYFYNGFAFSSDGLVGPTGTEASATVV